MAGMAMPSTPGMGDGSAQKAGGDPCCDHAGHHGKAADTSCAQACATNCVVAVLLASSPIGVTLRPLRADVPPARIIVPAPYEPPGLKRPPKLMA